MVRGRFEAVVEAFFIGSLRFLSWRCNFGWAGWHHLTNYCVCSGFIRIFNEKVNPVWRRRISSARFVGVDCGVEVRVVIHFELAIELEAAGPTANLTPKLVEACGEIVTLLFEQCETVEIAIAMGVGRGRTAAFFSGVVDLERKDGETVEDESRGFGVKRCCGLLLAGGGEQQAIEGFYQVIALLIKAVYGMLETGDGNVGCIGFADLVLLVPEVEVGAVMSERELDQFGGRGKCRRNQDWLGRLWLFLMPALGGIVLHTRNFEDIQHGRRDGPRRTPPTVSAGGVRFQSGADEERRERPGSYTFHISSDRLLVE